MESNGEFSSDEASNEPQPSRHGPIPILSSSAGLNSSNHHDPMDTTSPRSAQMPAPPKHESNGTSTMNNESDVGAEENSNDNGGQIGGAAAAAQLPKVVQTAFIHKLYGMLEDHSIQHVISWSRSGESFMISPTSEFSKVLASFFKHTNISSFVRQLNMYGFHKVSDVFAAGGDSPLWEFRHGNGNFKRGDLAGLREIKRRASKQQPFVHREPFVPPPKIPPQHSVLPPEPTTDSLESRMTMLEYSLHDMHGRLSRSEESNSYMNLKCQSLTDSLLRCLQWTHDMSNIVIMTIQDPSSSAYRDAMSMQKDVVRQMEVLKSQSEQHEHPPANRQSLFTHNPFDLNAPLSPPQAAHDDHRRHSLAGAPRSALQRPVPSNVANSARSYFPNNLTDSLSSLRAQPAFQQQQLPQSQASHQPHQHPLTTAVSPPANLSRRHTSADIRSHGWQGVTGHTSSPYASGNNSSAWPSSPHRTPHLPPSDPPPGGLHDTLSRYQFPTSSTATTKPAAASRQASPPPPHLPDLLHSSSATNLPTLNNESSWIVPGSRWTWAKGSAMGEAFNSSSGPPTRRSSMASNVHNLLNPAETAERADEEDEGPFGPPARGGDGGAEDFRGKRKRVA